MCTCATLPFFLVRKVSFHEHFHLGTWSTDFKFCWSVGSVWCARNWEWETNQIRSLSERGQMSENNYIIHDASLESEREWGRSWRSGKQRSRYINLLSIVSTNILDKSKLAWPGFEWEALLCPCLHSWTKQCSIAVCPTAEPNAAAPEDLQLFLPFQYRWTHPIHAKNDRAHKICSWFFTQIRFQTEIKSLRSRRIQKQESKYLVN